MENMEDAHEGCHQWLMRDIRIVTEIINVSWI